jgi:hypothetical protein
VPAASSAYRWTTVATAVGVDRRTHRQLTGSVKDAEDRDALLRNIFTLDRFLFITVKRDGRKLYSCTGEWPVGLLRMYIMGILTGINTN